MTAPAVDPVTVQVGRRVGFTVDRCIGWNLHSLDERMADRGWPGAQHYDPTAGTTPVDALQRLVDGRRNLVPGELDALAQALRLTRQQLCTPVPNPPRQRPGVLDRALARWTRRGVRS